MDILINSKNTAISANAEMSKRFATKAKIIKSKVSMSHKSLQLTLQLIKQVIFL